MGGPENGNFHLLYVVKMALRRWVVQKSLKTPLRNIKMAPNRVDSSNITSQTKLKMSFDCYI